MQSEERGIGDASTATATVTAPGRSGEAVTVRLASSLALRASRIAMLPPDDAMRARPSAMGRVDARASTSMIAMSQVNVRALTCMTPAGNVHVATSTRRVEVGHVDVEALTWTIEVGKVNVRALTWLAVMGIVDVATWTSPIAIEEPPIMPRGVNPRTQARLLAMCQRRIDALRALAADRKVLVAGKALAPADAIAIFQAVLDAHQALRDARMEEAVRLRARRAADDAALAFDQKLQSWATMQFAPGSKQRAQFGAAPRGRKKPTTATKAEAAKKALATRAARKTMGKRQRAKIKGKP